MTQAQFETKVFALLGLPSSHPRLTTTLIGDWLFQTMCDWVIAAKPAQLRTQATANLVANSATVLMPSDMWIPIAVKILETTGGRYLECETVTQEKADMFDPDWENTDFRGPTTVYANAGIITSGANRGRQVIRFIPTPLTSITAGVLYRYWRKPEKLSVGQASEIVEIPSQYHDGLAHTVAGFAASMPGIMTGQNPEFLLNVGAAARAGYVEAEDEQRRFNHFPVVTTRMADYSERYWGYA